ncbi:MAG TPA: Tn3 family transposase [Anaeromyxobacteraceae bacterium]|nr:Tn3 family transposase [Anaeromyxobacteraceae bacterium]
MVRIAASLRDRSAPAHVDVDRLAAASSGRPASALTMFGRIVKMTYILRYTHDPAVRDRVHLQLNRRESRHALAKRIFFGNQGVCRSGDVDEITRS